MRSLTITFTLCAAALALLAGPAAAQPAVSRDAAVSALLALPVAPEHRCSPYDRSSYPYSQEEEARMEAERGGLYGPYTGTWFNHRTEADIEHIIALSEAHDSGLCALDGEARQAFSGYDRNLTSAGPILNREEKGAKDFAEWQPDLNACWMAGRIVEVRTAWGLTVDSAERSALLATLRGCSSLAMIVTSKP